MPLYDYRCPKCDSLIEVFQKHDAPAPKCEHDNEEMIREFNTPAFKFANGHGTDMGNTMSISGIKRTQI